MPAQIIDGKALAESVRAALRTKVAALAARGVRPGLAAILAGTDPASRVYVRNKVRACEDTGVHSEVHEFPERVSEGELLQRIAKLNADPRIHGVLVQLPLPGKVDASRVLAAIAPTKDADGFHAESLGALVQGRPGFVPGTPAGVMALLEHAGVPLAGRHAVIVGRSTVVGKPAALLLLQKDATVTICHSRTPDLAAVTRQADILVAAVGRAKLITADMVKPGACVIDVGINRSVDGKLVGDVDFDTVKDVAGWITPVPGGVGPMTVAILLVNTVKAAEQSLG
ncbi:MAG: bifunctional methylenetetrahydrofolate dehydrogenase/methenyltetrahydrofolate cyclohydrolase FolD [Proteobacteria bacterium]|nr:bifunctional methylenetetrahydrofolate dehydrogenase/methenyltetrahydrofolate cyclohydrolase FolD [Pseudomonadota bacterium]MDA0981867.1 bifunctional methylenetetrahydrofolate dehydrogenase/methenyltetrahydrofolate cyclohydrolase FolD [Pseudomonadota bacterium]